MGSTSTRNELYAVDRADDRGSRCGSLVRLLTAALVIAPLLAAPALGQAAWYVSPFGSDANDGQTWGTAFATIQKAVTSAVQSGGYEIWVAEGTYVLTSSISIPSTDTKIPLQIYGGFAPGDLFAQRDWVRKPTVVDGNGVVESVFAIDHYVDLIDGLIITGGTLGSLGTGGGIDIRGCGSAPPQPVLRNLVIRGNGGDTSHPPAFFEGGGIYIEDCSPWILNTTFSNNRVWAHGGALFANDRNPPADTYPRIINSTFTANHSDVNGGAVGANLATLTIANSILWGNTAGDGLTPEVYGGTLDLWYNDIGQTGFAGSKGNIQADPEMFGAGRYHLRDTSPCIDAGDDSRVPAFLTTDFDDDDRFVDGTTGAVPGTVDMGADEYVPGGFAGVFYVDGDSGADVNNGESWGSAVATIQQAVLVALADAEIWIKQGTYSLSSTIDLTSVNPNLAFYGGFSGTEALRAQRSTDASLTVIAGNSNYCVSADWSGAPGADANITFDGLTFDGCGTAVEIEYGNGTTINNCRFINSSGGKGAVRVTSGDLEVASCEFRDNRAADNWAGAINFGPPPINVTDSLFIGNSASGTSGDGGALKGPDATLDRCVFLGNTAARNGGAVYTVGLLTARNSVFSGNQACTACGPGYGWGGAIAASAVDIANITVVGNSAVSSGGLSALSGSVTNAILWDNPPRNTSLTAASGVVTYSLINDPGYADYPDCLGVADLNGNVCIPPLLVDPNGGDGTAGTGDDNLRISGSASPAVDAGDSTALAYGSLDLDGNARHNEDLAVTDSGFGPPPVIDIGAYEHPADPPAPTYDLTIAADPGGGGTTIPAVGVHTYATGSVVQVVALPAAGWQFTGWAGWVADANASSTFVDMNWHRTVTASFKQVESLAVSLQGAGVGTVTSDPAGIDCPGDCSEIFEHGTEVTLSVALDPGTHFDGWAGGGCSGVGDCDLTMDREITVAALCNLEGACGIGNDMTLENMTVSWSQLFEACSSIAAGNDFALQDPAIVTFRAGERVVLSDGFKVGVGAQWRAQTSSDVGIRGLDVGKIAVPDTASEGDPIDYTISVENIGTVNLTEVSVTDDKCSAAPIYQGGDDGDSILGPAEIWSYQCSGPAEADDFINIATATFVDGNGDQVVEQGTATVTVSSPGCASGNRYEDQANGTILDCDTNLLWLKDASCGGLTGDYGASWPDVATGTALLADGFCGLTDGSSAGQWRVPAMVEMCGSWPGTAGNVCVAATGLVNTAFSEPAISDTVGTGHWSEGDPFIGVESNYYWTATEDADDAKAWSTGVWDGQAYLRSKGFNGFVWPVRNAP